ncbi:MAG: ATP-binding cassette domain-containing protein [Acaryochloris sp. RU_4_1]|nr:ATP-binding cassette domain-containing protein [Acaryochloris sp. RU_4_1]NJR55206.1 ATP-binding cassette domain-containing protein [Acaryochloris sp. CRU_2_0]
MGRQLTHQWIWQNINFELFPGDRLAIVDPSGVGKTLLLRAIAGLDPIQAGEIIFQRQSLSSLSMPRYRAQVFYLHQQPALLEGTVEFNLQQVYRLTLHNQKAYNQAQILSYLSSLQRDVEFLSRSVEDLSGGEVQIVACLRALQLAPQVLLLDEPTASMDEATAQQIEALIVQWQQADSLRSCIWTSHNASQLQRVTEHQLILKATP